MAENEAKMESNRLASDAVSEVQELSNRIKNLEKSHVELRNQSKSHEEAAAKSR